MTRHALAMKAKPKTKASKIPRKLLAAYSKVVKAMEPLSEDEQWRVVRAAVALFERHP